MHNKRNGSQPNGDADSGKVTKYTEQIALASGRPYDSTGKRKRAYAIENNETNDPLKKQRKHTSTQGQQCRLHQCHTKSIATRKAVREAGGGKAV
jgi:hypothetical protein